MEKLHPTSLKEKLNNCTVIVKYHFNHNVLSWVLCLSCAALLLNACTGGKQDTQGMDDTRFVLMELSDNDTTKVLELATAYIEHLKANEYQAALDMLHTIEGDSTDQVLVPLNDSQRKQQEFMYQQFPVLQYSMKSIKFRTESDCQIHYEISFAEDASDEGTFKKTSMFLQPIRFQGEWYLTVRDVSNPASMVSRIKN